MTSKKLASSGLSKRKQADIEWVGGTASMPTYVTGESEPYRPELLVWMDAQELILGFTMTKPGELLSMACDSLRSAIEKPLCGRPHAPTRVRLASAELAEALREGYPGLEVVCAPTPELDEVLTTMVDTMEAQGEQSYLAPDIEPKVMASFFQAAAALFRAKPWKVVPSDQCLFSVTIETLGMHDAALSVIGQMGESLGFVLFSGLADFEAYCAAADAMEDGEAPRLPRHLALNFDRGAELSEQQRKEIAEHGWEVASPHAYPWLAIIDEDLVMRPPTAKEATIVEAIALALPKVLTKKKALIAAWEGGEPLTRTMSVDTHQGEMDVILCVPYPQTSLGMDASKDL